MELNIRKENINDIEQIHEVITAAFLDVPYSDQSEPFIVKSLRDSGALTASLLAERDGHVLAHVALSPVSVSNLADGWYGLGPISVAPAEQSNGIGSQLMFAAMEALKELDAKGCVLLGDPKFYQRFGFRPVEGLVYPGVPQEYFQALLLEGAYPEGEVVYHEAFSAVD